MGEATIVPSGKPSWSREAAVGDYGGDPSKRASSTEGNAPYAWLCYRELQAMRGSAYSQRIGGTLVHCENLATARLMAWWGWRMPEKLQANSQPATADDALPYWVEVLKVPSRSSDQKWQIRQRCAAHQKAILSLNLTTIQTAVQALIGDVYVDSFFTFGDALSTPPVITFWPGVNPGPADFSLGGGAWISERSRFTVVTQIPPGMPLGEYRQLVDVQLFQLLHRMLPAYCTFGWTVGSDGFFLDVSSLDLTGLTPS
ncbi:MAG TPA: hypothetical protein VL494_13765 [Steroidobacteraceae bacterium]|jgi:hypothetical protein|nr:hypothetical protein [Steroidobacteraceae bacterium]